MRYYSRFLHEVILLGIGGISKRAFELIQAETEKQTLLHANHYADFPNGSLNTFNVKSFV